jgi:hypothetical protein
LVARASDDGGEDSARRIVSGEAGLAHTGAVIDHEGSNVFRHGSNEKKEKMGPASLRRLHLPVMESSLSGKMADLWRTYVGPKNQAYEVSLYGVGCSYFEGEGLH